MNDNKPSTKEDDKSYKILSTTIYIIMILTFMIVIVKGKANERSVNEFRSADAGVIGENVQLSEDEKYMKDVINIENEVSKLNNNIRSQLSKLYDDEDKYSDLILKNAALVEALSSEAITWDSVPESFNRHYELLLEYISIHSELANKQLEVMDQVISDNPIGREQLDKTSEDLVNEHNDNISVIKDKMNYEFERGMINYSKEVGDN